MEIKMKLKTTAARLRHQGITHEACAALEQERERILRKTGILKPRYEILSEIVMAAFGGGGER